MELVNWAATLPNSNGRVGMFGTSYLAINQLFTAAAVGRIHR
ncbi:X-Pro dipeptidyl-peptidase family protein [Mycobacterium xenopi 3993]|nr:X-Pro dipeptidyl-peptidase family protein [Mycobacterium xenopi 3993]